FSPGAGGGRLSLALLGAGVSLTLSALHAAWALGFRWGLTGAVPHIEGRPAFVPSRLVTWLVAGALLGLSLLFVALSGMLSVPGASVLALVAASVFALRTVGDFRSVGLFR